MPFPIECLAEAFDFAALFLRLTRRRRRQRPRSKHRNWHVEAVEKAPFPTKQGFPNGAIVIAPFVISSSNYSNRRTASANFQVTCCV